MRSRRQIACVLGIFLLVGLPAAGTLGSYEVATINASGDIFGDSELVVLEPETWIGKRFPLLKYIDIGDQLAEGDWIVVLYRHDCPQCRRVLSEHSRMADTSLGRLATSRIALVQVPPYGRPGCSATSCKAIHMTARLDASKAWFVKTPVAIFLEGGLVKKPVEGAKSVVDCRSA